MKLWPFRTYPEERDPKGLKLAPGDGWVAFGVGSRPVKDFWNTDLIGGLSVAPMDLTVLPLPFLDNEVDLAFFPHVLEHIPRTVAGWRGDFFFYLINDIIRIVRNGGIIEIHSPHWLSPGSLGAIGHHRTVNTVTFHPWRERWNTHSNELFHIMGKLRLRKKIVIRSLKIGPITDWHFRHYLGAEIGRVSNLVMIFEVIKNGEET